MTKQRFRRIGLPATLLLLLALVFPALAAADTAGTWVPIGGGYESDTLEDFARTAAERGSGDVVKILVVPSAYGDDDESRAENIELAGERTQEVEDACTAILAEFDYSACDAELVILLNRADAEDPANSIAFTDPEVDAAYILGGDQTIAVAVLAESPAETVMTDAFNRGVIFGGNSAGAAVDSLSMIAGYTDDGYPENGLEKDAVIVWWANGENPRERGLAFGAQNAIFDQHFYERGRFGRLFNIVAQSDERFEGESKVGIGVDWGTGATYTDDALLSGVVGYASVGVIDMETHDSSIAWVGETQTLSARNVLVHILAGGDVAYDVTRRVATVGGADVVAEAHPGWGGLLTNPGPGTLILGGEEVYDPAGATTAAFAERVAGFAQRKIVVVAAGYEDLYASQRANAAYVQTLRDGGLYYPKYQIVSLNQGDGADWAAALAGAAGVVFIGGDQQYIGNAIADPGFVNLVNAAVATVPVVMTDGAMTAAMGSVYVANADPTDDDYQEMAEQMFWTGNSNVQPGLGIIAGAAFEPRNTYDQRWGRLFGITTVAPDVIAFGISEMTAIVLENGGATVVGERSVVAVDGRGATVLDGDNGAFTELNTLVDIFAPGDAVTTTR